MKKTIKVQHILTYLFLACIVVFSAGCKKEYSLQVSVQPIGCGSVDLTPNSEVYTEGTEVIMTPNPITNYMFKSWGGADSLSVINNKIVVDKDMTIVANFEVKTMFRLTTGSGLNSGAEIYFVALSKNVNYLNLSSDQLFEYNKSNADWYIDGGIIPFMTAYKEFDLSPGVYNFLVSASGTVMVTTITVNPGLHTIMIFGNGYGLGLAVTMNDLNKSELLKEDSSLKTITYKR